jgi:protein-disulfide isomerase
MQRVFKEQYITPSIEMHPAVKNNFITGQMLNVTGTPQMFVNGYPYSGYLPPKQLVKIFVNPNG